MSQNSSSIGGETEASAPVLVTPGTMKTEAGTQGSSPMPTELSLDHGVHVALNAFKVGLQGEELRGAGLSEVPMLSGEKLENSQCPELPPSLPRRNQRVHWEGILAESKKGEHAGVGYFSEWLKWLRSDPS